MRAEAPKCRARHAARGMALDDPARVERILDDCVRRGIVEQRDGDVRGSREWKAWLTRAAEVLNRQVAETGFQPPGHPVHLAVEKALAMRREDVPAADREDYVRLLTLLELADMSPLKREQYGPYP